VRRNHITYPVIRDIDGNFVRSFGTTGVPETFVIDRKGRVVAVRRYQLAGNWLQQTVARVLQESA
jgi:cytochrome c biogenesis protein CcmG/thiol:disulfide interchange protein DsbE